MGEYSFLSALRSNLKCALCDRKICNARFSIGRKKYYRYGGTRYVWTCEKEREARLNKFYRLKERELKEFELNEVELSDKTRENIKYITKN